MERRHVVADALLTVHASEMDAVFRKYARYVAAIAHRVLHDRHDVEDVVQEVFLDAVLGLDRLRDEAALRAWLGVVTIRTAMQRRRQRSSSLLCAYDDDAVNEQVTTPSDHDHHLKLSAVAAVIDSLPHELRLPWVLHSLEGVDLPGVARACACSVATAKRRIALVRARIACA